MTLILDPIKITKLEHEIQQVFAKVELDLLRLKNNSGAIFASNFRLRLWLDGFEALLKGLNKGVLLATKYPDSAVNQKLEIGRGLLKQVRAQIQKSELSAVRTLLKF